MKSFINRDSGKAKETYINRSLLSIVGESNLTYIASQTSSVPPQTPIAVRGVIPLYLHVVSILASRRL